MGGSPVGSGRGDRHVLHGDALCQRNHVAPFDAGSVLVRKGLFHECVAAAPPPFRHDGYARGAQYRHRLPFQSFQHALSGILAFARYPSPCLFRGVERHHRLHSTGQAVGRACEGEYDFGHPQTDGAPAPDGDARGAGRQPSADGYCGGACGRYPAREAGRTDTRGRQRDGRLLLRGREHADGRTGGCPERGGRWGLRRHHQPERELYLSCREGRRQYAARPNHPHGAGCTGQ